MRRLVVATGAAWSTTSSAWSTTTSTRPTTSAAWWWGEEQVGDACHHAADSRPAPQL